MNHLDDIQLVDAIDGRPDTVAAAHLHVCAPCRARVEELRATLHAVAADEVPEPSPLFWTHFSARVSEAIDSPPSGASRWLTAPRLAWAACAAVLVVAALVLAPWSTPEPPGGTITGMAPVPASVPAPVEDAFEGDMDNDEAWAVMRSLAGEIDYDDAREAGILPRPGSVERAAMEMTDTQRAELARLIEADLKRTGP